MSYPGSPGQRGDVSSHAEQSRVRKKASDRESAEAIVGNTVPEGPNVVVLQVTVSKSTVARTRKESQGEGIVTRSGWKGGHVKRLNFASSLRSNRQ